MNLAEEFMNIKEDIIRAQNNCIKYYRIDELKWSLACDNLYQLERKASNIWKKLHKI